MRSPPVLSDEEAATQAALSRDQASELVRSHLQNHRANNPGASSDYVTWIATLHPENADITIDQRFFVPGNPWWMIYEDTKNNKIPTATAIPVIDAELQQEIGESQQGSKNGIIAPSGNASSSESAAKQPHFCLVCNPVNLFSGFVVATVALVLVLTCEMLAMFVIYLPGALFFCCAQPFSPPNPCTGIFYSFFMIFYYAFALCDSILLITSVLLTETLACVGYIISFCTGGILISMFWHQQIRRSCHGIRVWFRKVLSCNAPRHFVLCLSRKDRTMDQQNLVAESVSVEVVHLNVESSKQ